MHGSFQNTKVLHSVCLIELVKPVHAGRCHHDHTHLTYRHIVSVFIFKLQLSFILQDLLLAFHLHHNLNHSDGVSVIFKNTTFVSVLQTPV